MLTDKSNNPAVYAQYRNLPEEFDAFYVADEIGDRFTGNKRGL